MLIGVPSLVFAETEKSKKEIENPPADEQTLERRLIQRNIEISEWFDSLADGIDMFLVGERLTKKKNESRVTVENTTYTKEAETVRNYTSIGVFPRFPNLERYWALKFTSYDEKEDRRNSANKYFNPNARRQNYGATVAWYRHFGGIKTSFEPRIELNDPLSISHSLTFESVANFQTFEFNPKLELYASARRGPGLFQGLNWNFHLSKKWSLTLVNEGDYLDRSHTYNVTNGFSFGNLISRKSTMSYALMFNSNNRSNYHLESYVFSVSWNELVYKKIFDYTLTPYLEFARGAEFRGHFGGIVNLRLNF